MNINLAYKLWKDVKINFLNDFAKYPFYIYLLSLFAVWAGLSYIFFHIIRAVQFQAIKMF